MLIVDIDKNVLLFLIWCESSRWTGGKHEVCKFIKTVEIDKKKHYANVSCEH